MKNKIIIYAVLLSFLMMLIPFSENVKSMFFEYQQHFTEQLNGTPFDITKDTYNFMYSAKNNSGVGKFICNSSAKRGSSGIGFQVAPTFPSTYWYRGWWNLSYTKTLFLTNFSWYNYINGNTANDYFMTFYNNSLGRNKPLVKFRWYYTGGNWRSRFYVNDIAQTLDDRATGWENSYVYKWGFKINNSMGLATYNYANNKVYSYVNNATAINEGYRIDRIYIENYVYGVFLDDLNYTISDSYSIGGTTEGCIDTDSWEYYQNGISGIDGAIDINTPEIEFTSHYKLNFIPEVFELFVGTYQFQIDDDYNNYYLYINGLNLGNPICDQYYLPSVSVLQWNISSISSFENDTVIFELYHSVSSSGIYWNIVKSNFGLYPPAPNNVFYKGGSIDSSLDGDLVTSGQYGSVWRIFYSVWIPPEPNPEPHDNAINLINFKMNHPLGYDYYLYELDTGFIEVFSNKTENYYNLTISWNNGVTNGIQTIPIYNTHSYFGYTPEINETGLHWVNLSHNGTNVVNTTFYVDELENDSNYNPNAFYKLWTYPNPSGALSSHKIGVYISNFSKFDYYSIAGFNPNQQSSNYNISTHTVMISALGDNNIWETTIYTFMSETYEVWRLFGSNDGYNWLPLTSPYRHYINAVTQYNYISTNLSDGNGYINSNFLIHGQHSYDLSRVGIFWNDNLLFDNVETSFKYTYQYSNEGVYELKLKVYSLSGWEQIGETYLVKLTKKSGGGGGGDGNDDFNNLLDSIPEPYTYFIGTGIIIFFLILPLLIAKVAGISDKIGDIIKFTSIGTGITGYVLVILLGFYPIWTVAVFIAIVIIIALFMYMKGKQTV